MSDKLKLLTPATLTLDDKSYSLPTYMGVEGEKAIDITKLRSQTGYMTLDDGYGNTGACESAITYIDGEKGILRYRGYPIEELAENSRFTEVAYLLLHGELPNNEQLLPFSTHLNESSIIHEDMHHFFNGFPAALIPWGFLPRWWHLYPLFILSPISWMKPRKYKLLPTWFLKCVRSRHFLIKNLLVNRWFILPIKYKYTSNFMNMMFASPVRIINWILILLRPSICY